MRWLAGTLLCTAALVVLAVLGFSPPAAAGGGGTAGVRGSGDEIISSILAATGNGYSSGRPGGRAPRCYWRTLTDDQVLYLVHVNASKPELLASGFGDAIDEYIDSQVIEEPAPPATTTSPASTTGPASTTPPADRPVISTRAFGTATVRSFRLKVRICDGVADSMRVIAEDVSNDTARRMAVVRSITVLPPPGIEVAPSGEALVGEPVFFTVTEPPSTSGDLQLGSSTVAVRARPRSLTLFDGQYADDVGRTIDCGFGSGFDAASTEGPHQQARRPGACVFHYNRATGDPGDGGPARRASWLGYAKVRWDVSYTITHQGTATSGTVGGLYSFSLFDVTVGEVESVLEG